MNKGSEKHTIEEWIDIFKANKRLYDGLNLTDKEQRTHNMLMSLKISYNIIKYYINNEIEDSYVMIRG